MLASIYDLLVARPHECNSVKLSSSEWRAYEQGYYMGVRMALRVAELAVERTRLAVRTRRESARRRKSA